MSRIAVLGGGPAGAFTAERLARAGMRVTLIDEKLAWEKPCGGGLTYKAYNQYPFLFKNDTPKKILSRTRLASSRAGAAELELTRPILIYSRFDLNNLLLRRAEQAGAQIEKTRVTDLSRTGEGWRLRTLAGDIDSDFCVIANGARNALRDVGTEWTSANKMIALGYFIPVDRDHIDIQFLSGFAGYIWVFPRQGHLSAGICAKGASSQVLRRILEAYLAENNIPLKDSTFYGHVIPSLEKPQWRSNRVAGAGWLAVGDAAGLVDPVTGEGLYYAMRSGDLAAEAILSETKQPELAYRSSLQQEFLDEMEIASRLASRLYLGKFLYGDVPSRMIQFMRRSPTLCHILQDLFAGTQGYLDLKARLMESLNGTIRDVLINWYFRRVVPAASTRI
jgi:geranylgeranyl reductase family protein